MNGWLTPLRRSRDLVRLACNIRRFLAEPLTAEQAADLIQRGVAQREARFLQKLSGPIYGNPRSPYRKLLAAAGCEYGDVARLVEAEGLDAALRRLAVNGVYLNFDEFKCRTPTRRGSQTFHFVPEDFDDPSFRAESRSQSGGSSGTPIQFGWSFALTQQWAPHWCAFFAANHALDHPLLFWTPGNAGSIGPQLACAKFGRRVDHWFVSQEMTRFADRFYANSRHWICRKFAGFPRSVHVAYHDTAPVLDCLIEMLRRRRAVTVNTLPSPAVRLCLAAREKDISLKGVTFFLGAEPLTPSRRETIESSGARATPLYGSTEAVWTGGQCPFPQHPDEVHVLRDLHAVIEGPRSAESQEADEASLLFTLLAPVSSKITLNTDIGDTGVIEYRRCRCLYDRMGCHQTIHTIRSGDKLTEFGATIRVADVCHVVENVLPKQFRAAVGDFQLVETRTPEGLPRYILQVHPRLGVIEEQEVVEAFLTELGKMRSYYGFMTSIWGRERVFEVRREPPLATARGKLLPFFRQRFS